MKILFLQNVLFDYRVDFYNQLARRGFDITVAHCGAKNQQECNFQQLVLVKHSLFSLHFQQNLPQLNHYDVVISMFDLHWPRNILPVLFKRRNRFIFWGHGLGRNTFGNRIRKYLINHCDGFILYNQQRQQQLLAQGIKSNKLFYANNTIYVSNAGRPCEQQAGRKNILFVGRLQARKRIDILLHAFALARQTLPPTLAGKLVIIGEGEEHADLLALAQRLGIEAQTEFLGKVTEDEQLKPHFDQALVYASPGAMGLGINHAFAYGVPILSNQQCHHGPEAWVLTPKNTLWINEQDDDQQIAAFAEHIKQLYLDKSLSETLGKQAYEDYETHCSMARMVDGFEHVLRNTDNNLATVR